MKQQLIEFKQFKQGLFTKFPEKRCKFVGCSFFGATLSSTTFRDCEFIHCNFSGANLEKTNLSTCLIEDCFFFNTVIDRRTKWPPGFNIPDGCKTWEPGVNLSGTIARKHWICSYNLSKCNIDFSDFQGATFCEVIFKNTSLIRGNLGNCVFRQASFENADLRGCSFNGSSLIETRFSNCMFQSSSFKKAIYDSSTILDETAKRYMSESGAVFVGPGVDLRGRDLRRAILCDANLEGADLSGADLSFAYFGNAKIEGAKFEGTILRGARYDSI